MNEFARRYEALVSGQPFVTADGIRCRITRGEKRDAYGNAADDHVLEVESNGAWRRLKFGSLGLMVEFLYRNEDELYPQPQFLGGEKLMRFLRESIRLGHEQAQRNLEFEQRNKGVQPDLFGRKGVAS